MKAARPAAKTGISPNAISTMAARSVIARAGLWSALALVLNLTWEIAQLRLYTIWAAADGMSVAWSLLHCSVGDVMIALAMFALTGMVLRRADWPASRPWTGGAMVVIGALAYTAWSEWYNVYRAGSWSYTASMPLIFGIGLSPLLQWLILPPVVVVTYRTLGAALFDRRSSRSATPAHDSARMGK
jgi:hypothetical protein